MEVTVDEILKLAMKNPEYIAGLIDAKATKLFFAKYKSKTFTSFWGKFTKELIGEYTQDTGAIMSIGIRTIRELEEQGYKFKVLSDKVIFTK